MKCQGDPYGAMSYELPISENRGISPSLIHYGANLERRALPHPVINEFAARPFFNLVSILSEKYISTVLPSLSA